MGTSQMSNSSLLQISGRASRRSQQNYTGLNPVWDNRSVSDLLSEKEINKSCRSNNSLGGINPLNELNTNRTSHVLLDLKCSASFYNGFDKMMSKRSSLNEDSSRKIRFSAVDGEGLRGSNLVCSQTLAEYGIKRDIVNRSDLQYLEQKKDSKASLDDLNALNNSFKHKEVDLVGINLKLKDNLSVLLAS